MLKLVWMPRKASGLRPFFRVGLSRRARGDFPQAVVAFRRGLALSPNDKAFNNQLSEMLLLCKEFDKAIDEGQSSAEAVERARLVLAEEYETKRKKVAQKALDEAVDKHYKDEEMKEKKKKAEEGIRDAPDRDGPDGEVSTIAWSEKFKVKDEALKKGSTAQKAGTQKQVPIVGKTLDSTHREACERAVQEKPDDAMAHYKLGKALMHEDTAKAEIHLREATRLDDSQGEAWMEWGKIALTQNRVEDAKRYVGRACELGTSGLR